MKNLRKLRKAKGFTQKQLADLVDVSDSMISQLESGVKDPSFELALKIAEVLDCESADLVTERTNSPALATNYVTFPIIGEVAAHYDHFGEENWTNGEIDIPESWLHGRPREEYFVLRVDGDSMHPDYQNGDIVLVHSQPVLDRNGQIAVVRYDSEIATLKRVDQGEGFVKLYPINTKYPPLTITGDHLHMSEFSILGIPKMLIRNIV